jgi:hypothetical protein
MQQVKLEKFILWTMILINLESLLCGPDPDSDGVLLAGEALPQLSTLPLHHKVNIYKEYHSVCPLVGIGPLPPLLSPASVPFPPVPKGGGGTLACG